MRLWPALMATKQIDVHPGGKAATRVDDGANECPGWPANQQYPATPWTCAGGVGYRRAAGPRAPLTDARGARGLMSLPGPAGH